MKLNKQGRDELRAKVKELLESVPEGQRIHLEKDIVEALLFDSFKCEREKGKIFGKLIVWSGPFLSKLDLSEVSFDDVVWDGPSASGWYTENDKVESIDLSNTNARIDFSKSFYAKGKFERNWIQDCNFANVDLSNNLLDGAYSINNCNFSNTGLNIILASNVDDQIKRLVGSAIKTGALNGCYVNGKRINTLSERQAIAQRKRAEYEKMKASIISSVSQSIENQKKFFKKSKRI